MMRYINLRFTYLLTYLLTYLHVIQSVCILDAANVLGWMMIHASWSLLRLFQLTTTETAPSHLMSNLVHVMSKSVYYLYFVCA